MPRPALEEEALAECAAQPAEGGELIGVSIPSGDDRWGRYTAGDPAGLDGPRELAFTDQPMINTRPAQVFDGDHAIVGTWWVVVAGAPFRYHLMVFRADGGAIQLNPHEGNSGS